MNELFSQGGKGSTGILTSKQAIARKFGIKQSEVVYFSVGVVLSGYKVIYDKTSQRAYSLPANLPSGTTAISLSAAAVLVHSEGTVDLGELAVTREEYVTLPGSFTSGVTVNTKNELVVSTDGKYRWDGALPKDVIAGSTPTSTGGIGLGSWVRVGEVSLRTMLSSPSGSAMVGYKYKSENSASIRSVDDVLDERVSLWDFHCDANGNVIQPGMGVDSRPYIQKAIDVLYASGGGTLIIPTGTWYLNSYGVSDKIGNYGGIIHWRSNVNIHFEAGSVLKLTSFFNEKGYCVICGFDGNDPVTSGDLRDAMITGNGTINCGDNNVQPVGGALAYAIATGKSYNVTVRDVHITGGDLTWAATLGWNGYGKNTIVDSVTVTECKKTDIDRNVDQSLFYVGCIYSGVRNTFISPAQSGLGQRISCGVELHQGNTFCENNYIEGCVRGVYVVLHSQEIQGQGPYMSNVRVTGNSANITGQFCTIGAEKIYADTHISDVIIADNVVKIVPFTVVPGVTPITQLIRCFIASDVWITAPSDSDTYQVLVRDNSFFCSNDLKGSSFFFFRISTRGMSFSGNHMDCARMISGDGTGSTTVELLDIIWDNTNTLGTTWLGHRSAEPNLIELYVASIIRCRFEVNMPYEDSTIANIVYVQPAALVSYSAIKVGPDFISSSTAAVGVGDSVKTIGTNSLSYPANVNLTCYDTVGAVTCYSTSLDFGWVNCARALTRGIDSTTFASPPVLSSKSNGQLIGLGIADTGEVRTWMQRFLLEGGQN